MYPHPFAFAGPDVLEIVVHPANLDSEGLVFSYD